MSDLDVKPRPARTSVTGGNGRRQTKPGNWTPFSRGGIGVIPRRALTSPHEINTRTGLASFAENSPLRLLALLESIDPDVALANDTDITLICDPECVQIVAYSDTNDDTPEPNDTELLTQFWDSLPSEVGGLYGFMAQMVTLANFTGLMCAEAVPGRSGAGLYRAWPVDSLTIGFGRDEENADLTAYQRQTGGTNNGWQRLNGETFFWETVGKWPDSPYGCARYAPALAEVLVNTAMWRSITDAVQNAAWPRLGFGFDVKGLVELFKTLGYTPIDAEAAAIAEMKAFKAEVNSILADDNVFFDSNGNLQVIPGGSFQGIEPIIEERRSRIVRALKTLPLFLGLNDSTTETQAAKQMILQGKRLGALRNQIVAIAVKISNLHLRLLGRPTVAKAVLEPIFPGDALQEANAEAVRIQNAITKRRQRWIEQDQAAMEITGSGAVGEAPEDEEPAQTQPGDEEETRQERQSRERQSAEFYAELLAHAREDLKAAYHARNRERRLKAERGELTEV